MSSNGRDYKAIEVLLNQIVSDEGGDIPLMCDLEKMNKTDLDEISRLVYTLIDEKIAKTTAEEQVSNYFENKMCHHERNFHFFRLLIVTLFPGNVFRRCN